MMTAVFAEEKEEIDPDVQYISDFLIDLIAKYDDSGKQILIQVLERYQ